MIAVDRPPVFSPPLRRPQLQVIQGGPKRVRLTRRLLAAIILVALLSSFGGGGLVDGANALSLQAKASALHARWQTMRAQGIPDDELAPLEQQWTDSQKSRFMGASLGFWWPGGTSVIQSWQSKTDAIWARDLANDRARAVIADRNLHSALGTEGAVEWKARLDALASASTPGDFSDLAVNWELEAKLVPIDRRIATTAGLLASQQAQARALGIKGDPAPGLLAAADAYANLGPSDRMAHQRVLTRSMLAAQADLASRITAATATQQALGHASDELSIAGVYGIDLGRLQPRIAADRVQFAGATTVAQFQAITVDANQVWNSASGAINVALSQTHIIAGVNFYYQDKPLSCEEASTSMALTHQGIYVSQDEILAEVGADLRPMYVDGQGRVRWGNPYETFVGNVNGSESNYTGFGTYYPPLVRVAKAHGAKILDYGRISAGSIYARVIAGHPVVAFSTWDWQWHPRRDYLSFDGQWIPWIGPVYASHVYVVVGVSPTQVLVNDPIRGQYWISKASFEAGYSDFNEAIVFA